MKPDLNRFLAVASAHLMTRTAPALDPGYEQASAAALGAVMIAVGEEVERAAARRVEENRVLRALFADAAPVVAEQELRSSLERAAGGGDPSLLISDLERSNAELRALLITLHAHVEELDSRDASRIESAIWHELVASTERRKLLMGPF